MSDIEETFDKLYSALNVLYDSGSVFPKEEAEIVECLRIIHTYTSTLETDRHKLHEMIHELHAKMFGESTK